MSYTLGCARCGMPDHSTEFHDAINYGVPTDDAWEYAGAPGPDDERRAPAHER